MGGDLGEDWGTVPQSLGWGRPMLIIHPPIFGKLLTSLANIWKHYISVQPPMVCQCIEAGKLRKDFWSPRPKAKSPSLRYLIMGARRQMQGCACTPWILLFKQLSILRCNTRSIRKGISTIFKLRLLVWHKRRVGVPQVATHLVTLCLQLVEV